MRDKPDAVRLNRFQREIDFRSVQFPWLLGFDLPVLRDVSFTVKPAKWVAISSAKGSAGRKR